MSRELDDDRLGQEHDQTRRTGLPDARKQEVLEIVVCQAMDGLPWKESCSAPMRLNGITVKDVEAEVGRRLACSSDSVSVSGSASGTSPVASMTEPGDGPEDAWSMSDEPVDLMSGDLHAGRAASRSLRALLNPVSCPKPEPNPSPEPQPQPDSSVSDDAEVEIACWPHGNEALPQDEQAERQKERVKNIVCMFGFIWILVFVCTHFRYFNYGLFNCVKFLILGIVPLLCMLRGCTHLKLNDRGIEFLSRSLVSEKSKRFLYWSNLSRVYLDKRGKGGVLDCVLCFKVRKGRTHKIKLSKIANRQQWIRIVDAINRWSMCQPEGLDRDLFDSLSHDRNSPTFTMLWLEAMSAPPRRERLHPLVSDAVIRQGRYRVVSEIGAGGQGRAYLAEDTSCGDRVVLKEYILPLYVDRQSRMQAIKSFEKEASILGRLDHPGIVKLLDFFIDDHRAYHVLEFIDGESLESVVAREGPLAAGTAVRYAGYLASILEFLHSQVPPIVHGDFTPDNIMITSDGRLKLIDFMAATQQSDVSSSSMAIVGKHSYMAPEQFRGQLSPQCDLYALGCTVYYLSVGKEPMPLSQHFPILDREDVTPGLSDIVARCTALDPGKRFASARAVGGALQELSEAS